MNSPRPYPPIEILIEILTEIAIIFIAVCAVSMRLNGHFHPNFLESPL